MPSGHLTRHAAVLAVSLGAAALPRSRRVGALTAVCVALAPSAALAQQADEYKPRMDKGVKLYRDKNYEAAIVEFRAAYKIRPKASPLINISLCYKGLFDYPKAIAALEEALAKHRDTMDPADKKAAEDAITEMRDLLAYVTIAVTPKTATVTVDGEELSPEALAAPVPLGPGTHRIGARAEGHASAEQSISIASGEKDRKVSIALTPDKGHVTIRAGDPQMAIAVDQQPLGYGEWSGFLTPGSHLVQMYRPGKQTYNIQIVVAAGTTQEIRPDSGGVPLGPSIVAPPPTTTPPRGQPPPTTTKEPPKRGFFGLATGSLLVPVGQPKLGAITEFDTKSGGAGGFRVGYRVNTPASFDFMFEYGNIFTTASDANVDIGYSRSSFRVGLNLRLMTPGKTARFVGTLGGGLVVDDIEFTDKNGAACPDTRCSHTMASGVDPYFLNELGLELDFGGVLVGASLQSYFQSAKGIDFDNGENAYTDDVLMHFGGGLRVGYAFW